MRRDARTPQEVLEEMMDDQPGSQCAGVDGSCDDRLVLVGEVKRLRAQLDAQQILIERQSLDAEDAVRYIEELEQERDDLRLELSGWDDLLELQRKREQPWVERWQQETGKADTLPDYGEFLGWLIAKLDEKA